MAVALTPDLYGQLLDLYGGMSDLEGKLVRVLHGKSFIDDATRIWRAVRYEQRLSFHLESGTLELVKRDVDYLKKVSGDRIRHELELILKEEFPEKALCRADELRVLSKLHPKLKADDWLSAKYEQVRQRSSPDGPSIGLYLALLVYRMGSKDVEEIISYLRLRKASGRILLDTINLKENLGHLVSPQVTSGQVYTQLAGCAIEAVVANIIAAGMPSAVPRLTEFIEKLRYIRPVLNGEDLKKLGVTQGPEIKEMLHRLLKAKLDGKAADRRDEEALVLNWRAEKGA
jgi:tRNA nucleotidyltransferase (CCA-adding enzyme)